MHQPGLILCERTSRWALALRRTSPAALERIRETRSLAEGRQLLEDSPASFVALELAPPRIDAVLNFLARLERDFPLARAAVLANRELADYQWLARELGAVDFRVSPRWLGSLAEIALRHLALAPPANVSFEEKVLASLPWGQASADPCLVRKR